MCCSISSYCSTTERGEEILYSKEKITVNGNLEWKQIPTTPNHIFKLAHQCLDQIFSERSNTEMELFTNFNVKWINRTLHTLQHFLVDKVHYVLEKWIKNTEAVSTGTCTHKNRRGSRANGGVCMFVCVCTLSAASVLRLKSILWKTVVRGRPWSFLLCTASTVTL